MPVKKQPPAAPSVESLDGEFKVRRVTMRGVTYVLTELPADEYEKCLQAATETVDGRDRINNGTLLKLMMDKALVEPKITAAAVFKKPYPVVRALNDIIDELHYTPEEPEEDSADDEDSEGEAEG